MAKGFKNTTKTTNLGGGNRATENGCFAKFKTGGRVTIADLNRANRDTGGLDRAGEQAAGAAIARGNRMQALEAREEALLRKRDPKSSVRPGELAKFK